MTDLRTAAQIARDALDELWYSNTTSRAHEQYALATQAIREALKQPAAWVGLTEEDLDQIFPAITTYHESNKTLYRSIARAIETKLREKNGGQK